MSPTVIARKLHTTTLAAAFTYDNAVEVKLQGTQLLEIKRQSLNYGRSER
jgi:hypothetical protein